MESRDDLKIEQFIIYMALLLELKICQIIADIEINSVFNNIDKPDFHRRSSSVTRSTLLRRFS